jgi:hypothetical protein
VREIPNEDEAWKRTKLRSSKYLNNLIEQDHRGIKSRTRPVLGFKNFDYAAITIAGVELLHRIRKVNLPCIAYVSKTKLRLRSGMHSLLHKPLPLQSPQPAYLNIYTRARLWTIHSKRHTGSSVCSLPVFHERADRRLGSLPDVGSD